MSLSHGILPCLTSLMPMSSVADTGKADQNEYTH